MNIPDLKQLDKLIALCRKRGVKIIKMGEMELTLSDDLPVKASTKKSAPETHTPSIFETDSLTEQQLLEWSVMDVTQISEPGAVSES